RTQRISFASNEQQQEQTYEATTSSSPAVALPSDNQYSPYEFSRRGSRHTSASKARSKLSCFLRRHRTDAKQPTGTTSPESPTAHLGLSPVSPVSSVELESCVELESSPVELELDCPPAELPAETHRRAGSISN